MAYICEDTTCRLQLDKLPAPDKRGNIWCPLCQTEQDRQRRLVLKCFGCLRPAVSGLWCKPHANERFLSGAAQNEGA